MNTKEKNELFSFPRALDTILKAKFGEQIEAESFCDILGDSKFRTVYKAEGELRLQIEAFIEAFMAGNAELRNRLEVLIKVN